MSVGDLAVFSVRQEAALQICDARRAAAVAILDSVNGPPHHAWWKFWRAGS